MIKASSLRTTELARLIGVSFGAIFAGMLAVKSGILTQEFWSNSLIFTPIIEQAHHIPEMMKLAPLILSLIGIMLAYLFYIAVPELAKIFSHSFYGLYLVLFNKYYFDELYEFLFVKPYSYIANILWQVGDVKIIDGLGPNGFAVASQKLSGLLSKIQSGYVYNYILVMILGLVSILTWYVLVY